MMNIQRIVFSIVLALQVACVEAARQNLVPHWTPFIALLGTVLVAFLDSVKEPAP